MKQPAKNIKKYVLIKRREIHLEVHVKPLRTSGAASTRDTLVRGDLRRGAPRRRDLQAFP